MCTLCDGWITEELIPAEELFEAAQHDSLLDDIEDDDIDWADWIGDVA